MSLFVDVAHLAFLVGLMIYVGVVVLAAMLLPPTVAAIAAVRWYRGRAA